MEQAKPSEATVTTDDRTSDVGRRVIAYIDGFNLYYGLMAKQWGRYRWLDVAALARSFVRPPDHLVAVRYFTARSSHPPDRYLELELTRVR